MQSPISRLTPTELRVYAEIAHASEKGVCDTPATVMRRRCELSGHYYRKTLGLLEQKGLIRQKIHCYGVPRTIHIVHG